MPKTPTSNPCPAGKAHTRPDVFIIESLRPDDEQHDRFEGVHLARMLKLSGKDPRYVYFEDVEELPHIMCMFELSKCRFLHIFCHGTRTNVFTKKGMTCYHDFAAGLAGHLKLRRVFLSACELGNQAFSDALSSENKGMHSIAGPAQALTFCNAAAMWNAFYMSLFSKDNEGMKHATIEATLKGLTRLFPVAMHFSSYHPGPDNWTHTTMKPQTN